MRTNKNILKITLFIVLGSMAVGCQKEDLQINPPEIENVSNPSYTLVYYVNGIKFTSTYTTEEEYHAFILHLMALSREGNEIVVSSNNYATSELGTKETVTYTTSSENDATTWTKKMIDDGYEVHIIYDSVRNVYICIAIK